jgi:hypothetical protein
VQQAIAMRFGNRRAALQYTSAFLFGMVLACDRVERETLDRLDDPEPSTWTSRRDCETLLAGRRQNAETPRIGTWNIRYFPDSQEQSQSDQEKATDVPWLACAIASLDVDVLAVQEFKTTDLAIQKQGELIQRLNELTSGDWQLQLAACNPAEVQHPGFLYDASRITGTNFREIPILNPNPVCDNVASPGFGGYFKVAGGPDFHLISVHFTAGNSVEGIEGRDYSFSALQAVADEAIGLVADNDVFFTGDFNTSGCPDCSPEVSSAAEVAERGQEVAAMATPLTLLGASESCTRHVDNDPPLMDLFLVSQGSAEVPGESIAHVSGICEATACGRLRNWLEDARNRLSDHCPVLLDLGAQDDD